VTALVGRTGGALAEAARDARTAWTHRHTAASALVALTALLPAVAPSWVHVDSMANGFYLALAATGLWLTVALGLLQAWGLTLVFSRQGVLTNLDWFGIIEIMVTLTAGTVMLMWFGELITVRQQQPLGLGHAVWCARHVVGDEPFAVLLPDDPMAGKPGALKQMVDAWGKVGGNLVATEEVPAEKTKSYGIITPGATTGELTEVRGLVEKPDPSAAPSRLGIIGRYILQPDVMRVLDSQESGAGGEIQLTDAMAKLIGEQPFHALKVEAVRYDCGDRAGFVIANLAMALERDDVGPQVREFIAGF